MLDKQELKPILEALIFAADSALGVDRIASILEGEEKAVIKEALDELVAEYAEAGGGFTIEEVAGGYQYRTNPEYAPYLRRLFKIGLQRISKPAMEALAIVAYKQPVTRAEVEAIRGVDSGGVLATLMEKRFIRIVGRKELPGRPVVYGTTKEFLETFDLNDLSCLPSLKDIQKMEEENGAQDALPEEESRVQDTEAGNGKTAGPQGLADQAGAGTGAGETDGPDEEDGRADDDDFEEFLGTEFEELPDEAVQELSDTDRNAGEEDNDGEGQAGQDGEEDVREAEANGQDSDAGEESDPGPQDETGAQGETVGGDADERSAEEEDGSGRGEESDGEDREETAGEGPARGASEAPEDNSDGGDSVPEKS